jgi:hypothetical protein
MATNPENNANHDKSGQTGASPREYSNHQRHSTVGKLRHSAQAKAFLSAEAVRLLGSASVANTNEIFAKLTKYGATRVKAATNISQLP